MFNRDNVFNRETRSLQLSRECIVHSVICVLFIVIAVKDVIPRRPRHFTETNIERKKQITMSGFIICSFEIIL